MMLLSSLLLGFPEARQGYLVATEAALKVVRRSHLVGVVLVVLAVL